MQSIDPTTNAGQDQEARATRQPLPSSLRHLGLAATLGASLALGACAGTSGGQGAEGALAQQGTSPAGQQYAQAGADDLYDDDDFDDALFGYEEVSDPLEVPNRLIFAFNQAADTVVIRPVAVTYSTWTPQVFQDTLRNFLRNLGAPVTFLNEVLQGEFDRAQTTLGRFVVNSTIGFAGLGDPATEMGLPYQREDFGQTLAVWGVGDGPYLVLPILGPSNLRDTAGLGVDVVSDPWFHIARNNDAEDWLLARGIATGIDARARSLDLLDELERDSVDFYARIRSLYQQRRQAEVENRDNPATDEEI